MERPYENCKPNFCRDYWGSDDMAEGLEDVAKFSCLFAELIRHGWSDADLKKLAGENILRALRQAEATAQRLQKSRPALRRRGLRGWRGKSDWVWCVYREGTRVAFHGGVMFFVDWWGVISGSG